MVRPSPSGGTLTAPAKPLRVSPREMPTPFARWSPNTKRTPRHARGGRGQNRNCSQNSLGRALEAPVRHVGIPAYLRPIRVRLYATRYSDVRALGFYSPK